MSLANSRSARKAPVNFPDSSFKPVRGGTVPTGVGALYRSERLRPLEADEQLRPAFGTVSPTDDPAAFSRAYIRGPLLRTRHSALATTEPARLEGYERVPSEDTAAGLRRLRRH
jgi:hypothetical protein